MGTEVSQKEQFATVESVKVGQRPCRILTLVCTLRWSAAGEKLRVSEHSIGGLIAGRQ